MNDRSRWLLPPLMLGAFVLGVWIQRAHPDWVKRLARGMAVAAAGRRLGAAPKEIERVVDHYYPDSGPWLYWPTWGVSWWYYQAGAPPPAQAPAAAPSPTPSVRTDVAPILQPRVEIAAPPRIPSRISIQASPSQSARRLRSALEQP